MSALTTQCHAPRLALPAWREHGLALGVAVALHAGLAYVLLNLSHQAPMTTPVSPVITTELVNLPAPVAPPPAPVIEPPAPAPIPEPVIEAPQVEHADLAFKRVEQQRKEKARQQAERERQQRREEAQRQERLAREEQQRQALLQAQAEARQAEAERQAASAAAAARADAQAASQQYLPITKHAPDYPARALERKIEGECTVAYTVSASGRVESPHVVGSCHPLFVKPSLAAARTFRYQPKVVNGQAVAVANVKNTFNYTIE